MRRLIFSLVLFATAAFAQPEIAVSTPHYGPAPGDQMRPQVATNGSDFLVAWNDNRGTSAVYAQRVKADGTVLDGTGIRVADGVALLGVFRAGGIYTLILTSSIGVASAASIDDDGVLVEPPHTVMTGVYARAAASNGTRIVLGDSDGVTILDEHGHLIERNVLAPPMASWIGLGSNGSTFLLVTGTYVNAQNSVHFTALDGNGHVVSSSQRDDAPGGDRPIIASDGDGYLVVYLRDGGVSVAVNVDRAGVVKSVSTLPQNWLYWPASALQWSGSSYLLSSFSLPLNKMAIGTISRDGTDAITRSALGPTTPGATDVPSIAWNGSEALVVWTAGFQSDPNGWEVLGAFADAGGGLGTAPMVIPRSGNAQRGPAIASGGTNDLAVWNEGSDLYAARITHGGVALDGAGILVAHNAFQPQVIFDGEAYLVAWLDNNGVHAQRIDAATGALLGGITTLFGACAPSFNAGRDNVGVLLVVQDCSNELFAQRVGIAGPVGGPVPISPSGFSSGYPRMAWNGSEWLIVFDKLILVPAPPPVPNYRGNVYAERLSSALAVLDAQPIPIAVSPSNYNTSEWQPIVASDGRDFLVAWTRQWNDADGTGQGVRVRPVRADGGVGDPVQFVEGGAFAHSIVWDGMRYAVAYDIERADYSHQLELTHGGDRLVISGGPEQHDVALTVFGGVVRPA
ncbi:MAG TPA: hypothetical protein VG323_06895, partial [Thermoanaerobaculia bacterium]|nr:hypothetical protein [Thermoanaerobaculia bacterium]